MPDFLSIFQFLHFNSNCGISIAVFSVGRTVLELLYFRPASVEMVSKFGVISLSGFFGAFFVTASSKFLSFEGMPPLLLSPLSITVQSLRQMLFIRAVAMRVKTFIREILMRLICNAAVNSMSSVATQLETTPMRLNVFSVSIRIGCHSAMVSSVCEARFARK